MVELANKKEKYTIEEYRKLQEKNARRKFRLEFYPLPVMLTLCIPFVFLIMIALTYFFYIKNLSGE